MKALFLILFIFTGTIALSQNREFPFPDETAEFPGGAAEMKKFIMANMQYPETARLHGDDGRVYVSFIVEADGKLSNIGVLQSVSKELDAEAIRIMASMPRWKPAKFEGENIPAQCRMPITFTLDPKTRRKGQRRKRRCK